MLTEGRNKFRAWVNHVKNDYDFDSKQWSSSDRWRMAEVLTLHINKNSARCRYMNQDGAPEVHNYDIGEHCIIMQCTGLHDKNGREIYEGDIVRFSIGIKQYECPVVWNPSGMWSLQWAGHVNPGPMRGTYEVVGHIFEAVMRQDETKDPIRS